MWIYIGEDDYSTQIPLNSVCVQYTVYIQQNQACWVLTNGVYICYVAYNVVHTLEDLLLTKTDCFKTRVAFYI